MDLMIGLMKFLILQQNHPDYLIDKVLEEIDLHLHWVLTQLVHSVPILHKGHYGSSLTPLPNGPCNAEGSIGEIRQDVIDGCVLINLFAPSVFAGVTGEFATAAERDYLFDESIFDTVINQEVMSAYATGTIMSAPAGDIAMVVGIEKQNLEINSIPDFIADEGLLVDFTSKWRC